MVRTAVLVLTITAAIPAMAQDTAYYRGSGLLRGSGAISPGFMMDRATTNIYVNGKLEYFTDDRVSFRGEGFWYIDSQQLPAFLRENSQVAAGPFYHFGGGRLDAALGFEAGVSFAQPLSWMSSSEHEILAAYEELRVIPNAALCAGITYTVWDHFHFFLDARYVHARYTGGLEGTVPLDETVISAGLGFQFRCRKGR